MQTEQQTPTTERSSGTLDGPGTDRDSGDVPPSGRGYADVKAEGSTPDADAPAWFRSRKLGADPEQVTDEVGPVATEDAAKPPVEPVREAPKLRQPGRPRKQPRIVVERPPEEVHWKRRMLLWVTGFAATGYGVSLLIHGGVLTLLAFQYFNLPPDGPPGGAILGFSEDNGQAFDFGEDDSLFEEAGGPDAAPEEEQVTVVQALEDEGDPVEETKDVLEAGIPEDTPTKGGGTGDTDGAGTANANTNPGGRKLGGGNTFQQGSFIVRVTSTKAMNPESPAADNFDPQPGEPYFVYIYISLPEEMSSVKINDIQGSIVGTDKWKTDIPYDPKMYVDNGFGFFKGREGATTYYLNPRSRNRLNPFSPVNERDVERNRGLPIVRSRVGGETVRSVVLRIQVGAPKVGDQDSVGITDTIRIRCEPLDEQQQFQITF